MSVVNKDFLWQYLMECVKEQLVIGNSESAYHIYEKSVSIMKLMNHPLGGLYKIQLHVLGEYHKELLAVDAKLRGE